MSCYKTQLTVLEESAARFGTAPAFKVPLIDSQSKEILRWENISYSQFLSDVEHSARYWSQRLAADGIASRSTVGVWLVTTHPRASVVPMLTPFDRLGGMTYVDVLHIYGIMRAGFVPQMFSLRLPNPSVIFELLSRSCGKALVYDASFSDIVTDGPIPTYMAFDIRTSDVSGVYLPPLPKEVNGEDPLLILHTSGSTSGRPKLVPLSYAWWDFGLQKSAQCTKPYNPAKQDVNVWM